MYWLVWKNNFDNVNIMASFNKDRMSNDVGTSRLSGCKNGHFLYDLAHRISASNSVSLHIL